jgi:hypothetical protein
VAPHPAQRAAALTTLLVAFAVACTATSAGPAPAPGPSETASYRPLLPGMQRAWLHGVGVDAPGEWKRDALHCGKPQQDTLVVQPIGTARRICTAAPGQGLSVVWLGDYQGGLRRGLTLGLVRLGRRTLASLHPRTVGGMTVLATSRRSYLGGTLDVVVLPHRHVYVLAWSPDADLLARTIESLQTIETDPDTHCSVFTNDYDDVKRLPATSGRTLVPKSATGADACYYVDGWLEGSESMTAADAQHLGRILDAAPRAPVSHDCRQVRQGRYAAPGPMALRFHYAGGKSRVVVARILSCNGWSSYASNGTVTKRLGLAALDVIPRLWGYSVPHGLTH